MRLGQTVQGAMVTTKEDAMRKLTMLGMAAAITLWCATLPQIAMAIDCKPGDETVATNLQSLIDGFNSRDLKPFTDYVDDKVVIVRFQKPKPDQPAPIVQHGKADYHKHLKDTWDKLTPYWRNPSCVEGMAKKGDVFVVLVHYDFEITTKDGGKTTIPSFAVLSFQKSDKKLIDATFGPR